MENTINTIELYEGIVIEFLKERLVLSYDEIIEANYSERLNDIDREKSQEEEPTFSLKTAKKIIKDYQKNKDSNNSQIKNIYKLAQMVAGLMVRGDTFNKAGIISFLSKEVLAGRLDKKAVKTFNANYDEIARKIDSAKKLFI